MSEQPQFDEATLVHELKGLYADVTEAFLNKSINSIKEKNWEKFKGFTQRRSRPASGCEFSKEITDFFCQRRGELISLLQRFKDNDSNHLLSENKEKVPPNSLERIQPLISQAQPYSVTKMLRNMSSSSSSSSN